MSVTQRGNSFQASVSVGTKRIRKAFATPAEAHGWEREARARIELGQPIETIPPHSTAPITLKAAFAKLQERIWVGTRGADAAILNSKKVMAVLGESLHIGDITVGHIDTLISRLRATGNSDATVNRKLAALSPCLSFSVERGWIASAPKIERLPEFQGRIRFLSDAEESAILKYFQWSGDEAMGDLCTVLIDTGLRLGEALKITAKDLDFNADLPRACIRIWENKADLPRSVPMTMRVKVLLHKRAKLKIESRIFSELDHSKTSHRWNRMKSQIGLGGDELFVPHVLRHTTASRLVQRGIPMKVIQEWLGHRSVVTTMRYAHLAPANLFMAADALEPRQ